VKGKGLYAPTPGVSVFLSHKLLTDDFSSLLSLTDLFSKDND